MVRPVDPFINPMDDYLAEAERRDRVIPDKDCRHGVSLRVCGYPECIETRARLLRREGRTR